MHLTPRDLPHRGRGLVATTPLPAGAAVCTDAPRLLVLAADATGDACAACLRRFAASPHAATPTDANAPWAGTQTRRCVRAHAAPSWPDSAIRRYM